MGRTPGRLVALLLALVSCAGAAIPSATLRGVLEGANAVASRAITDPDSTASYLGNMYVAEYYVFHHLLANASVGGALPASCVDPDTLRGILLSSQLEDGSWMAVYDANKKTGELEPTVWSYFALKVMGEDLSAAQMVSAKNYILNHGGLSACNQMNKLIFALFGNYNWHKFLPIPLFIFEQNGVDKMIYIKDWVSQWVYPHLVPMAYLIHFKPTFNLGPLFSLNELQSSNDAREEETVHAEEAQGTPSNSVLNLIAEMFSLQQPLGSFGSYTLSTMLSIAALEDFVARFGMYEEEVADRLKLGVSFIETLYCIPGYWGNADHGEYWDAVLLGAAIQESNAIIASAKPSKLLTDTAVHVAKQQQANGGIPFGKDFWYAPDTDDTAESVLFWSKLLAGGADESLVLTQIERGVEWLTLMQNDDGGFGAFAKNCDGHGLIGWVIGVVASQFADSAEIFDPSSVDVTAHVLEAWGTVGMNTTNQFVMNAINYIQGQQHEEGYFDGRWAINTVYCTAATIVGLSRVQYPLTQPWVQKAVSWILSKQNEDGGFGEGEASYDDPAAAGLGISTPTQTAWAVLGMLEAEKTAGIAGTTAAVERAEEYLVAKFTNSTAWTDPSVIGTGHPKIVYMQYLSYPLAFPLLATSRYYNSRYGQ
eukprot:TRINITY_DN8780_c0_g1_i1.p1 TRINITY_DN8780_c0_g1~~TRINITY_DN8780_c0_g1_i1.p1  ORF type:complete len:651 (-),score=160.05 TRINITY_DN8780_c0_g1_i1:127-2079(-)